MEIIQNLSEPYKTQLATELKKLDDILEENLADPTYTEEQKNKIANEHQHLKQILIRDFSESNKYHLEQQKIEDERKHQLKMIDLKRREQIPLKFDQDGIPIYNAEKFPDYDDFLNILTAAQRDILEQRKKNKRLQEEENEKQRAFEEKRFRISRIIHDSGIPNKYTKAKVTDFFISDRNEAQAIELFQAVKNDKSYYIFGDNGTGKTLISSIIVNERAKLLKTSVFMRSVKIFTSLNPFYNHSETILERKHLYEHTPCLIIDDLGVEKPSDFTKQSLFEIIDSRYNNNLQTIITSNFNLKQLIKRIGEYEGKRIARRILEMCKIIELQYYDQSPFAELDDD